MIKTIINLFKLPVVLIMLVINTFRIIFILTKSSLLIYNITKSPKLVILYLKMLFNLGFAHVYDNWEE